MDVRPRNRFRNKSAHWLHKALNWLENEHDGNFRTNGEFAFLKSFVNDKKSGPIVIFDVGANTGEYGDLAMKLFGENERERVSLYSFEPIARFAGHGTFVQAAISDVDGKLTMYKRRDDDISSVARQEWLDRKHGAAEEVSVPSMRLDSFITQNRISHIDLLKVDVEGHELNVLKGCGKYLDPKFISVIQFEYGLAGKSSGVFFQDLYELLTRRGYKVYKIHRNHLEEATLEWAEAIQYANFVAVAK